MGYIEAMRFSKKIEVPFNELEYNFSRSSGKGGQNVNKVNTKVEIRFNLNQVGWLDHSTKEALITKYPNIVSKSGDFIVTCQETRSQVENKAIAEKKIQDIINQASIPVAERNFEGVVECDSDKFKRMEEKKRRSQLKKNRSSLD